MNKKILLLGDFYYSATLEGYTLIRVNKGGYLIFEGRFLDLPSKYYDETIKHLYIRDTILWIDLIGD